MPEEAGRDERFIEWLEGLRENDDRATLAALRRGLGKSPGSDIGMLPYIARFMSQDGLAWQDKCLFIIASLFAFHPSAGGQGSLGTVMAKVMEKTGSASVEGRFRALLNSHADELTNHLRHAVSIARSQEVPIDWKRLLEDTRRWNHPRRVVQRRWASDFWAARDQDNMDADSKTR